MKNKRKTTARRKSLWFAKRLRRRNSKAWASRTAAASSYSAASGRHRHKDEFRFGRMIVCGLFARSFQGCYGLQNANQLRPISRLVSFNIHGHVLGASTMHFPIVPWDNGVRKWLRNNLQPRSVAQTHPPQDADPMARRKVPLWIRP